jgi:hypothetical protein
MKTSILNYLICCFVYLILYFDLFLDIMHFYCHFANVCYFVCSSINKQIKLNFKQEMFQNASVLFYLCFAAEKVWHVFWHFDIFMTQGFRDLDKILTSFIIFWQSSLESRHRHFRKILKKYSNVNKTTFNKLPSKCEVQSIPIFVYFCAKFNKNKKLFSS